jgi:DMSO/TMAO reductase YedYZ molybdopterin-dependent catalytic subunit
VTTPTPPATPTTALDPNVTDTVPGSTTPAITEIPPGAQLSPVTPFITPNDDFYLIDTALSVPRIDIDSWNITIDGMVGTPLRLSYDDLRKRPMIERMITIACVSNQVGGDLIGNAVWQGVRLDDLLNEAGVDPNAEQVFMTSVDGWTCGFPVGVALDGRDAMIAVGMNGEPLPLEHGFPARVIVPGLYGYVSATKWVERIELNRWDDAEGYWVPRGWSRDAPIKTQSRIDVPRARETVPAGRSAIAGIAWAQPHGVAKVEVNIDRTEWHEATLGTEATGDTWRQWSFEWDATPGEHVVQVRATDKTGYTQTEEVARPDPDGATGWHTRTFDVE